MTDHRRTLALAATAIDWQLAPAERHELDDHLASCSSCARRAQALRQDAARVQNVPQHNTPERVRSIVLDATVDRSRLPQRSRLLLIAAAVLLLAALIGGTVAVGALVRYFDRFALVPLPSTAPVQAPSPAVLPSPAMTDVPTKTFELSDSGGKIRLDVVDHSGNLVEARSLTEAELNAGPQIAEGEQFVLSNAGTPNALNFHWSCCAGDKAMSLTIDRDVRHLQFVRWPAFYSDSIGGEWGLLLTFSRAIPADSVQVERLDAGPAAAFANTGEAGLSWRKAPTQPAFAHADVRSVVAGGPGFVAVGAVSETAAVWTSRDGLAWSRIPHAPAFDFAVMNDVTRTSSGLVAVGEVPGSRPAAWTSTDGLRWERAPESATFAAGGAMQHVAAGGLGVVAAGGGKIWFSPDGREWERVAETGDVYDLIVGGPAFVAVGCDLDQVAGLCSRARAWTSADGRTWLNANAIGDASLGALKRVTMSFVGLVALGSSTAHDNPVTSLWISADGRTWRQAAAGSTLPGGNPQLIVAGGPGVVVVGSTRDGAVPPQASRTKMPSEIAAWTSQDGTTWTKVPDTSPFGTVTEVFVIAASEDRIVVIGRSEAAGRADISAWVSPRAQPQ
jgi:hypothetical protein